MDNEILQHFIRESYFLIHTTHLENIEMTTQIANSFQALVYRLEAQIARTETRLVELKAQLEASRKLAADASNASKPK